MQPVDLHGSHGREYATGRGAVLATREILLHAHAGKIANKDFIIQVCFLHSTWGVVSLTLSDLPPAVPLLAADNSQHACYVARAAISNHLYSMHSSMLQFVGMPAWLLFISPTPKGNSTQAPCFWKPFR